MSIRPSPVIEKGAATPVIALASVAGMVGKTHHRRRAFCQHCEHDRVFERRSFRHGIHAVIAVLSLGLWLGVWGLSALWHHRKRSWRCGYCGHRERTE